MKLFERVIGAEMNLMLAAAEMNYKGVIKL
jgi:hypothetical protein